MGGTRSRALTREFLIREEIAHAKDAKPRQEYGAQTRNAREYRGLEGGRFRADFAPRLRPRRGYGVETRLRALARGLGVSKGLRERLEKVSRGDKDG